MKLRNAAHDENIIFKKRFFGIKPTPLISPAAIDHISTISDQWFTLPNLSANIMG